MRALSIKCTVDPSACTITYLRRWEAATALGAGWRLGGRWWRFAERDGRNRAPLNIFYTRALTHTQAGLHVVSALRRLVRRIYLQQCQVSWRSS